MKLKRITAYVRDDTPNDEIRIILPSGFAGEFILVSEDSGYNVGASYPDDKTKAEIIDAIAEAK